MPDVNGLKEKITQPIGPLPAWGWVAAIVGGYFVYKFISGRSGGTTNSTAAGSAGSAGALDSSIAINNLTQTIKDLINKTTPGGTGLNPSPVTPKPVDAIRTLDPTKPGATRRIFDPSNPGGAVRIFDPTKPGGAVRIIDQNKPGKETRVVAQDKPGGAVRTAASKTKTKTTSILNFVNAAKPTSILNFASTTNIAAAKAIAIGTTTLNQLAPVVSTPAMPSNTAVTKPLNGVSGGNPLKDFGTTTPLNMNSVPTIDPSEQISSFSLAIPATTPQKKLNDW